MLKSANGCHGDEVHLVASAEEAARIMASYAQAAEAVGDTLPRFGLGDSDEQEEEEEGSVDEDSGFVLQKHVDRPLLLDVRTTHATPAIH